MSVIDRSQDARQSVGPIGKRRRLVVWTSRRGTHLGSGHVRPRQQTGHMIASDRIHTNKLLQPGGRPHMGPCFRRDDWHSLRRLLLERLALAQETAEQPPLALARNEVDVADEKIRRFFGGSRLCRLMQ